MILSIKDLHVYYGNIHALKGISLAVNEGEIVTLIGANGAGKTTTMGAVSGLLPIKSGTIEFEGKVISGKRADEITPLGIALSPEGRGLFPGLTVEENLRLGAYLNHDKKVVEERKEKCFDLFPRLKERCKQQAGTLSGGEQQMVAVSRALMSDPKLLMLDEPSMGLAPNYVELIFETIQQVNKNGVSVLLVEQNANMALSIANRGYVISTGEIMMTGTGQELLANPEIQKAYLGG